MISPKCDECGEELQEPGALLLLVSPPDDLGKTTGDKKHLCVECYKVFDLNDLTGKKAEVETETEVKSEPKMNNGLPRKIEEFYQGFYCEESSHSFVKHCGKIWSCKYGSKYGLVECRHRGYFSPYWKCYHCGMALIELGDGSFTIVQ